MLKKDGKEIFEVLKNAPKNENPTTQVSKNQTGVITVSDKKTGRYLYKVRPTSKSSIVVGKLQGIKTSVRITDKQIQAGDVILKNEKFETAEKAGVYVQSNGRVRIGVPLPKNILHRLIIDRLKS